MRLNPDEIELLRTIVEFAERSREEYKETKEWTIQPGQSCMTIRVPVGLLNRIREIGEIL